MTTSTAMKPQSHASPRPKTSPTPQPAFKAKRGRPENVEDTVRVQVTLTASLVERLKETQSATHVRSLPDLLKNALTLYVSAVDERVSGGRVIFENGDDRREYHIVI